MGSMNIHPTMLASMQLAGILEIARLNDEAEAAQAALMAAEEAREPLEIVVRDISEQDTLALDRRELQRQMEHERADWLAACGEEAVR